MATARAATNPPIGATSSVPAPVNGTVELPDFGAVVGFAIPLGFAAPVAWIWPSAIWVAPLTTLDGYGADLDADGADEEPACTAAMSPRTATATVVNDFILTELGDWKEGRGKLPSMSDWTRRLDGLMKWIAANE